MKSKVSELSEKLNVALARLQNENTSKLDIDVTMQLLRELYEELDGLRNYKPQKTVTEQSLETVTPVSVKPTEETEPAPPPAKEVVVEKKAEPVTATNEVTTAKKIKGGALNDVIKPSDNLNTKLKTTGKKEVYHKLSSKPLKELIDLNKRFVIVNSLFNNNANAFTRAIEQIDRFTDYEDAESFMKNTLAADYGWKDSSETTLLFAGLVKQRFGIE